MVIQGDNLEALKVLLPFYAGQVKCIYIDPTYNTHALGPEEATVFPRGVSQEKALDLRRQSPGGTP